MAAQPWPPSLPNQFERNGFNYLPLSGAIADEAETGSPMYRGRFTGLMMVITGNIILTMTEMNTLMAFWRTDLKQGVLRFVGLVDPIFNDIPVFAFHPTQLAPVLTPLGGGNWSVQLKLIRMP